jgi:hypothetical protein
MINLKILDKLKRVVKFKLSKNNERLKSFREFLETDEIFIVGNGYSLDLNYLNTLKNKTVFLCNDIYRWDNFE